MTRGTIVALCVVVVAALLSSASARPLPFSGKLRLNNVYNLDYHINYMNKSIDFVATLEANAWLAIGFSRGSMIGSYSVIGRTDTKPRVYELPAKNRVRIDASRPAQRVWNVTFAQFGGKTVLGFSRAFNPGGDWHVWEVGGLAGLCWAYGSTNTFAKHGNRGTTSFLIPRPIVANEPRNDTHGDLVKTGVLDIDKEFQIRYNLYNDSIAFRVTLRKIAWYGSECVSRLVAVELLTLDGAADRMGIGFGTKMFPNYAVVGYSGSAAEVFISGRSADLIAFTTDQLVFNVSYTQEGGHSVMEFARRLDPGNNRHEIKTQGITDVTYAYGLDNEFAHHQGNGHVQVDFQQGTFKTRLPTVMVIHALVMWMAWGLILPTGAFLAASGWSRRMEPVGGVDAWWKQRHRVVQSAGAGFAMMGMVFGIVHVITIEGTHAGTTHGLCGFILLGLMLTQTFTGHLRLKYGAKGRRLWDIGHGVVGVLLMLMSVGQMCLGFILVQSQILLIVMCCISGVYFIVLTWARCCDRSFPVFHSDSSDQNSRKSSMNSLDPLS